MKRQGYREEVVNIIRMQKWGVREHLASGFSEPVAMYKADEYTQFVLDRRFACRYLGMNTPQRITPGKICERLEGRGGPLMIWSAYFERPYIPGIATDKLPRHRFQDPEFARRFARLLGQAAAANLIVGRCDLEQCVLFDDGDEVVVEDGNGLPQGIIVGDPTGSFSDFRRPLTATAAGYAGPILRRAEYLPNPEEVAREYLDAFVERFLFVQEKYRRQRGMFDNLFRNRPYNPEGSLAYRWESVLKRLDQSDPHELAELIQVRLPIGCC